MIEDPEQWPNTVALGPIASTATICGSRHGSHLDEDLEIIAEITGQSVERLADTVEA